MQAGGGVGGIMACPNSQQDGHRIGGLLIAYERKMCTMFVGKGRRDHKELTLFPLRLFPKGRENGI